MRRAKPCLTACITDAAGDVFIADRNNSRVVELPAGGGPQFTVGSGLQWPEGLAVDAAGDLFIADYGHERVVEVPANGASQITLLSYPNIYEPFGVAVDAAGDLFISDAYTNLVWELPAGGGPQFTIGSGFDFPLGDAADAAGDAFIADTVNSRVVEVPAGGGPQTTVPASGLHNPTGVAVDAAGDVFIADNNNERVVEVQTVAVNFGNVNVCPAGQTTPAPCSQTLTLNYNVTNPIGSLSFGAINVVTQGTPNLDFTLASGSTCTGTVFGGSTACTVNVTFTPLAPGVRMGAVQLYDNLGNLLATTMVHGIGQGPVIAFGPGTQTTVPSSGLPGGLSDATGVAVDGAGDIFVALYYNSQVAEVPAGGGTPTLVGNGLSGPFGLALDGAGDVFVADSGNARVVEIPAGGGAQTTIGSGLNYPVGVAVDGAGNVFIVDAGQNEVVKVPAGGGAQTTVPANGLSEPRGVAVDGAGDIFIADSGNSRVVEVPAGGGPQTTVGSGLNLPYAVAVDGAGDVFIADRYNNQVVEVPAGGGPQTTVGSGLSAPFGLTVDGAGDVLIADTGGNMVVEVQRSQPPALSFATTVWGSTSSDSPQSVTIQNVGNQPLNAVGAGLVDFSSDFPWVAGSGTPADCTSSFSLAPGATCNLSISFTPQHVGNLTGTATVTDNTLNAPSATQSIPLQGTAQPLTFPVTIGTYPAGLAFVVDGVYSAQNVTWTNGSSHNIGTVSPQTPVAGTQYTFSGWSDGGALGHAVTATPSATTYTASFSTQYSLTASVSPAGGGTVTPLNGYQAAGSSVPLVATPSAGYAFSNWAGTVANANSASTSVTMSAPETVAANFIETTTTALLSSLNPSTFGQSATFTATVAATAGGTPTGTVTFSDGSNVLGTVSLSGGQAVLSTSALAAGGHFIVASYGGSATYQSSVATALTQTVEAASSSLGLTSNINPSVYNQAVTFTALVMPQFGGSATGTVTFFDFQDASTLGTAPVIGNHATLTLSTLPTGTGYIAASYSGDSNFTASLSHELFQEVKKAGTTTALHSSLNPAFAGQSITYTATVTDQFAGALSGAVNFESGGTVLGSATPVNGQASISVPFSTSGSYSITAKYVGDVNNAGSTSPALKQVVDKNASSTAVVSSLNPSIVGESVKFTATVTVTASGSPTGTVTFKSGATTLGEVPLTGNTASLSTSTLATGTHVITAVYGGNAAFAASTSPGLKQAVDKR
jgi:sugar lactone lactonase YvrE